MTYQDLYPNTGLAELMNSRGSDGFRNAFNPHKPTIVGEASTSIPNCSAYEILCAVRHAVAAQSPIKTFVVPGGSLERSIRHSPYKPTITTSGENPVALELSKPAAERFSIPGTTSTIQRVQNMVARAIGKNRDRYEDVASPSDTPETLSQLAFTDSGILDRLPEEDRRRIINYIMRLPATFYKTAGEIGFVEHVVRQRTRAVLELGSLILSDSDHRKLDNFSVDSVDKLMGTMPLGEVKSILGIPEGEQKIALTYDCPECSINSPDLISHYAGFDGSLYQHQGHMAKPADKRALLGCKSLGTALKSGNLTPNHITDMPLKDLLNAGFMLSGLGIYAVMKKLFDDGIHALGVANYNPSRGTVTKISEIWGGPVYITPRARIYAKNADGSLRIATYDDLSNYLDESPGAVPKFMDWIKTIPVVATGAAEYKFVI